MLVLFGYFLIVESFILVVKLFYGKKIVHLLPFRAENEQKMFFCNRLPKSCLKCKCRLDASVCNDQQCWNNDKCRFECKELIDKVDVMMNLLGILVGICECECDKSCVFVITIVSISCYYYYTRYCLKKNTQRYRNYINESNKRN